MKKKILYVITIMAIFLTSVLPVSAATEITVDDGRAGTTDPNSRYITNQATLTIEQVVANDVLTAYKILDAYYNSSTNVITYEFTDAFKAFQASTSNNTYKNMTLAQYYELTSGNITDGSTQSQSTLDQLASAYAGYVRQNSGTVTGTDLVTSGTNATATLDAGSYLVLPKTTNKVYAVMVGNLDFSASGTSWQLNNATIVAKASDAGLTKTVETGHYNDNTASATVGEEFTYTVTATVPRYPTNATNKTYIITDRFSTGLTFSGINSIQMKDGDVTLTTRDNAIYDAEDNQVATLQFQANTLTININVDYVDSTTLTVTYKASINENAVCGDPNSNTATLTYANDPYGEGTYTTPEDDGKVDVYTYGIEVFKYINGEMSSPLEGATFDVFSDADLNNKVGTITTGADGYGRLEGVAAGTYYLKETSAPPGYSLLNDAVEVDVFVTGSTAGTAAGHYRTNVPNTKTGVLPFTGGTGTIVFTVAGLAVIGGAFYFVYRRKNKMTPAK